MRKFLTTVLIIILQGCVPHSDTPLTDPDENLIDTSILGTWFWQEENETGYLHIGLDEESKLLRVIMLDIDGHKKLDESEYSGHTSELHGNRYLNLKWVRPVQDEITGYMLIKYTTTADSLGIAFMDKKVVETAVIEGSLKGIVKKDEKFAAVRITDGQKELQDFILQKDNELFTGMKYMQKLNLPEFKYGESSVD